MEVHDYFNILINGVSLKGVLEWNIRYEPSRHGQKRQVCSNSNMRAHRKDDELGGDKNTCTQEVFFDFYHFLAL